MNILYKIDEQTGVNIHPFEKFRQDDTDTVDCGEKEYKLFDSPRMFSRIYSPAFIVGTGQLNEFNCVCVSNDKSSIYIDPRYAKIMEITINLIYLEPLVSDSEIKEVMHYLNRRCNVPVGKSFMTRIFDEIKGIQERGEIVPIKNLERVIVINEDAEDVYAARNRAIGERDRRETLKHFKAALAKFEGKYTDKKFVETTNFSERTFNRYKDDLREDIQVKRNIKIKKDNKTLTALKGALENWDLRKGMPTYPDLAEIVGCSLPSVKKYGEHLRPIKEKMFRRYKSMNNDKYGLYEHFAPFDSEVTEIV